MSNAVYDYKRKGGWAPTTSEDIAALVKIANDATKGLDAEVRAKAFEIILNRLLEGRKSAKRKVEKVQRSASEKKQRGARPISIVPIPVDLKGGRERKSLREFFGEKKPATHTEKLTLFVYYLNKTGGIVDVLPGHALTCYNDVGVRKPAALAQLFADTIRRQGWLQRGGEEGSVRVSITGENLVEHDLPRGKGKQA